MGKNMRKIFEEASYHSFGVGAFLHRIEYTDHTVSITTGTKQNPEKQSFRIKNFSKRVTQDQINKFLNSGDFSSLPSKYLITKYYKARDDYNDLVWVKCEVFFSNTKPNKSKLWRYNIEILS